MAFSFKNSVVTVAATLALVAAQAPQAEDAYGRAGQNIGRVFSSSGEMRRINTADSRQLASAAVDAERAIATFESSYPDLSHLSPQVAQQQRNELDTYVNGLKQEVSSLRQAASEASAREHQNQGQAYGQAPPPAQQIYAPAYPQGQPVRPNLAVTNAPILRNKAVVKDESATATESGSASSTESSSAQPTTQDAKESKSESRALKSELKSESKESKSESKAEAKASKEGAVNGTAHATTRVADSSSNSTATSSASKTKKHHKSKNAAVAEAVSGGAIVAGAMLLLL